MLSDSEDSESDLSESEQVTLALELHYRKRKRWKKRLRTDPKVRGRTSWVETLRLGEVFVSLSPICVVVVFWER